jgi:hypothetical protein
MREKRRSGKRIMRMMTFSLDRMIQRRPIIRTGMIWKTISCNKHMKIFKILLQMKAFQNSTAQ